MSPIIWLLYSVIWSVAGVFQSLAGNWGMAVVNALVAALCLITALNLAGIL